MVNALDMAIRNRRPEPGSIVHADHGTRFTSWVFGEKIRSAGLLPSFGTVGEGLDNAMMESFWSSMQIELLNRKRWKTRVELANAIFEYIEIFHNRRRRHSALGYRTPTVRTTLRQQPHPGCQLATETGAQTVGQVKVSPNSAAVPQDRVESVRGHLPERYQVTADLGVGSGLRQGKAFAFSPDDVHGDFLHIERQVIKYKSQLYFGPPRGQGARRAAPSRPGQTNHQPPETLPPDRGHPPLARS
ncbi:Integrase core domain-containing protein [Streptomyces qinglanensis]|uniref:Integrase core domain-containing protein n=1 Tax=Streptomyces qinglanensis TaxID=943816 RepID=A0A1H9NTB1_9ACTN|nr:Integrase core domain-containing protein [Streptomyces qinglanensis]